MDAVRADYALLAFDTYTDYIQSFINADDRRYLQSSTVIEQYIKLGYRTTSKIYEREEFIKTRAKAMEMINPKKQLNLQYGKYLNNNDPGLLALAKREMPNVLQKTIIFLVVRRPSGFDISGYMDYASSLRSFALNQRGSTNWKGVFEGTTQLRPRPNHLSYYDLHKKVLTYNDSENYETLHIGQSLVFMHKGDHKIIHLDVSHDTSCVKRTMIHSPLIGTIIFYDHIVRKPI
ncbi:cilia- and flagella-associated protein 299 isoform X1 [Drosophila grimshawi]|uniref:cilia- and flagella-associated protein 299 isoform X1 n=1 Tax=Drosophila grimshawi TaxID=7222 RepID=UPI000C86ECE6|nr:cilia- and flagella-associated protein 299 isoform X1 [Drosophila grimshawi]